MKIPERNLNDPSTKGVQTVKFDLFDFSNVEKPSRISLDAAYAANDPMMHSPPDGLKVTITVGDNCASGSITLPLWFLSGAIGQLLEAYTKSKNSGLVGFDKKGIIGVN